MSPWLQGGGIERELEVKAPWLAQHGWRVAVSSWYVADRLSDQQNPVIHTLQHHSIPIHRLAAHGRFQLLQRAAHLALIARRGGFRLLVGHELAGNLTVILAKLLMPGRFRAVAELHTRTDVYQGDETSRWYLALARRLYAHADSVRAVSNTVRSSAAEFFRLPPTRIVMLYNPIPVQKIRALAREEPSVPSAAQGPFIVSCGRLTRVKRFPDLIAAVARLRARHAIRLVILGDGPLRAELVRLADAQMIRSHVEFPGFVANPYAYFSRARLFALPSASEGSSRVLVEAMACGTPVIASRSGGPSEVLDEGKHGLLYEPGDVDGLVSGIEELLGSAPSAALADGALRRAEEFSEEEILPDLAEYYMKAAG